MNYQDNNEETVAQKLRKANLKITPQRMAILSELIHNSNHPTADTVYQKIKQKLPNISFDTVNRTLITFTRNSIIKRTEDQDGAKRYDPKTEPHHHFHCIVCNRIIDFMNTEYNMVKLPESITKKHQVLSQKIVLDGICENCKNKSNNNGQNIY
ncbi:MAG: Fur family transcriptional regulator [Candidatus Margulisbacteria bacterium]|nr:Fur family transcriptional regulator [Candidatus Margulisiibacteriota bacterium]